MISFGDRLLALAVLETSLPSDKRWPGPLIRIFEMDTFFFLIRLRLIIASWALSASLKEDLATLAAFVFGREWCFPTTYTDNYIFVGSQGQISNNMLPRYIKQFWRKSDHKLRVIICSVISLDFEAIKNHFIHHIEGCACF